MRSPRATLVAGAVAHGLHRWRRALAQPSAAPVAGQPLLLPEKKKRPRGGPDRRGGGDDAEVEALLAEVGLAPAGPLGLSGSVEPSVEVLQPLHRRESLVASSGQMEAPAMMRRVHFTSTRVRTGQRLVLWLLAALRFFAGNLGDWILRRSSDERRAVRLRRMFERMGGTAVKIAQQMSMRIDLVSYVYSLELSKLLDQVPPFPVEQAVAAIERVTRRPLHATFASFDPTPIGSASVACVYQGVLHSGERVAVKVRRPGIGAIFAADCRAISWLLGGLELFTVLRPGFTANLVSEFSAMVLEELDFVKEARYTELFARGLRKAKIHDVRAPRVHFDISGDDVMVTEFITGVFMSEIIAAVEHKDQRILALLERLDIDPKRLARQLLRANHFCMFENLLFHADPHPANIIVRPHGEIVLIDFGSCGTYTWKERHVWRQLAYAHHRQDVAQMVQAALALIEPLPPIDIDEFTKRLEQVFWQDLYAFKSKHSAWWERTSAKIWISFLELSREYHVPLKLNMLRMIRSTLLFETVAARLWHRIDSYKEHHKYNREAGRRAQKRIHREVARTVTRGFDKRTWLRVEQLREMGNRAMYLMQRFVDGEPLRFSLLVGKAVFAVTQVGRAVVWLCGVLLVIAFGLTMYYGVYRGVPGYDMVHAVGTVLRSRAWQVYAVITFVLMTRRVLFRMLDREIDRDYAVR